MKKYKVTYTSTTDHDCCSVWCYANSREEAIENTRDEYWDVEDIIECSEIR